MSIVLTILFGLLGLGIIVFVHELGHFLAAKASGIDVETFSVGWGGRVAGFERGGTFYQISWFPIGGYCKMKGEMPRAGMTDAEVTAIREDPGSFLAAAPWRRIVVAIAGPAANFVFAVLVLTLIWWFGFNIRSTDGRVILVSDIDGGSYAADAAGLETGDRITSLNGSPVESFWEISEIIRANPETELPLVVEREGRRVSLIMVPQRDPEIGMGRAGIYAWYDPIVGRVEPGSAADIAGIRAGDRILAINQEPIENGMDLYSELTRAAESGASATVSYQRNRVAAETSVALSEAEIGVSLQDTIYRSPRLGLAGAAATGLRRSVDVLTLSVRGIRQLFQTRDRKLNDVVAGPIRITAMVGQSATAGFRLGIGEGLVSYFQFISLLSIAIALMNLLPLPALDGGLIILSAAEGAARKPLAPKTLWRFQFAGFIVIVSLIFLAVTSDILSLLG